MKLLNWVLASLAKITITDFCKCKTMVRSRTRVITVQIHCKIAPSLSCEFPKFRRDKVFEWNKNILIYGCFLFFLTGYAQIRWKKVPPFGIVVCTSWTLEQVVNWNHLVWDKSILLLEFHLSFSIPRVIKIKCLWRWRAIRCEVSYNENHELCILSWCAIKFSKLTLKGMYDNE